MPIGTAAADAIREAAHPLRDVSTDYDPLLDSIGDARLVLLGEASHGTHEFYRERALITRRLIVEKGFRAVAAEADWPDAMRVHRFVSGRGTDGSADAALGDFRRFPRWMWRNRDVLEFVAWLHEHNRGRSEAAKTGFYGLDLYSLHASIAAVVAYLARTDPAAAARARARYACFDHYGGDPQVYGASAGVDAESCEDAVVEQLLDLRRRAADLTRKDGFEGAEDQFVAEQNARLAKNAEAYYRAMYRGRVSSWNLRDRHMAEMLEALIAHLANRVTEPKVVVWAHNSHLGDARATEMALRGELNLGQLTRERHGREAVLVGFSTHHGTVTAATDWEGPAERKRVRPGLRDSYETLFHETGLPRFLLSLRDDAALEELDEPRLQRAIGVIYRPETERQSHYFLAKVRDQFDALVHLDETSAVEPLEVRSEPGPEPPETYPSGE
jgi:erythromycin esterase-like protein